jgi:hypothetical protein
MAAVKTKRLLAELNVTDLQRQSVAESTVTTPVAVAPKMQSSVAAGRTTAAAPPHPVSDHVAAALQFPACLT